jgi:hypothetical protein
VREVEGGTTIIIRKVIGSVPGYPIFIEKTIACQQILYIPFTSTITIFNMLCMIVRSQNRMILHVPVMLWKVNFSIIVNEFT